MKLEEFLENIMKMVNEDHLILEYEVVFSTDDEGNYFDKVHFEPSVGIFEEDSFISKDNIEEHERDEDEINAICIN